MARAAFPRQARLVRPREFRAVFAKGTKYVCPALVLITATNGHDTPRLGLALAKRRIGRAVDRHRVKRVIRESFRHRRDELGGVDVVVIARRDTAFFDNPQLFAQLARIWPTIARFGSPDSAGPPTATPDRSR